MPDEDLAVGDKEGNEVVYIYSKKPEFNFDIKKSC